MSSGQLPLAIRWPAQQGFSDYLNGDSAAAVHMLQRAAAHNNADWVFLSGPAASGKTHLLIASCAAANVQGRSAQYISLRSALSSSEEPRTSSAGGWSDSSRLAGPLADTIRSLGGSDLLAIDDVDAIAGNREAEHALFDLYNRCKVEKSTLLFAALLPPAQIGISLPDLVSRLGACTQAPIKLLDEAGRREVLIQRAAARGLTLDAVVLDWLFVHHARDLRSLSALFERIDKAALAAQRRVTVPFLRSLLS